MKKQIIKLSNGDKYEGEIKNGVPNGKGRLILVLLS